VKFLASEGLNVYDVLDHETLVLSSGALAEIEKRLKPHSDGKSIATKTAAPKKSAAAAKPKTTKKAGGAA